MVGKKLGHTVQGPPAALGMDGPGNRCSLELAGPEGCHYQTPCEWEVPSCATLILLDHCIHHVRRVLPKGTGRDLVVLADEPPTVEQEANAAVEVLGRAGCTGVERAEHRAAVRMAAADPVRAVVAVAVVADTAAERSWGGSSEVQSVRAVAEQPALDRARDAIAAAVGRALVVDEHRMPEQVAVRRVAAGARTEDKQEHHPGIRRGRRRATAHLGLGQRHGHRAVLAAGMAGRMAAGTLQAIPKAELGPVPEAAARNCRPSSQLNQKQTNNWMLERMSNYQLWCC